MPNGLKRLQPEITEENIKKWKERENRRFHTGEYRHAPFRFDVYEGLSFDTKRRCLRLADDLFYQHYPHVAQDTPDLLAYTPDDSKGIADRQLASKPGRYLTRFFNDLLTPQQIADLAVLWLEDYGTVDGELRFARTPDEIEHVYLKGPNSCMSYAVSEFKSDVHPCRVYGAGDLAVAYLYRTQSKRITARALVWEEKKAVGVIYGDEFRFIPLLEKHGFESFNDPDYFEGAKLLRIPQDGTFVMPYLDGDMKVFERGRYMIMTNDWTLGKESLDTCGLLRGPSVGECEHCGDNLEDDDDCYSIDDSGPYCHYCYNELSAHCEDCGSNFFVDTMIYLDAYGFYCNYCAPDNITHCEECETPIHDTDVKPRDDLNLCEDCADNFDNNQDE